MEKRNTENAVKNKNRHTPCRLPTKWFSGRWTRPGGEQELVYRLLLSHTSTCCRTNTKKGFGVWMLKLVSWPPERLVHFVQELTRSGMLKQTRGTRHRKRFSAYQGGVVDRIPLSCNEFYVVQTGRHLNDTLQKHCCLVGGTPSGYFSCFNFVLVGVATHISYPSYIERWFVYCLSQYISKIVGFSSKLSSNKFFASHHVSVSFYS